MINFYWSFSFLCKKSKKKLFILGVLLTIQKSKYHLWRFKKYHCQNQPCIFTQYILCKNQTYSIIFLWGICPTCKLLGHPELAPPLLPKHAFQHFKTKIENRPATNYGNPWLPPKFNLCLKFMHYIYIICKVESWYCWNIKDLWENHNGI